jgi:AbrB family looped-hinge helix DNA binding protein
LIQTESDLNKEEFVNNTFQVQVMRRGHITLPKELREQNQIVEGDTLTLVDLGGGIFILSTHRSRVDEIADKLAREWQESGETLDAILETLREVRTEYDAKIP